MYRMFICNYAGSSTDSQLSSLHSTFLYPVTVRFLFRKVDNMFEDAKTYSNWYYLYLAFKLDLQKKTINLFLNIRYYSGNLRSGQVKGPSLYMLAENEQALKIWILTTLFHGICEDRSCISMDNSLPFVPPSCHPMVLYSYF